MKKLKQNRFFSLLTVTLIYVAAGIFGVLLYRELAFDWWLSLLIADLAATAFVFAFSLIFANASVYDPYWSVQPPVILIAFALGKGLTALTAGLIFAVSFWALRLTANWAYTFYGLSCQDWRYTMLKEKTGVFYPVINFVGIHCVPTLVVYFCILPAVYAVREGLDGSVFSFLFILLSLLAALLQGAADIQMHKYRKNRTAPFIRTGLWKYSRHPNYLGEILMWWGVALAVITANTEAWHLALGAVMNTLLFLFVSIPMADGRQARKEGFAEYKNSTRMLLPIKKAH